MTESRDKEAKDVQWWVYILRCADGTLYCGSTPDVEFRLKAHGEGRGAKYTRGRGPFEVVYRSAFSDRSRALIEEARIKRLPRDAKLEFIAGGEKPGGPSTPRPEGRSAQGEGGGKCPDPSI